MIPDSFSGQVTTLACSIFGTPFELVISRSRERIAVRPRQAAMSVLREVKGYSFPRIGRQFGRDHTTVMHAIDMASHLLETDDSFGRRYNLLLNESEMINVKIMQTLNEKRVIDPNNYPLRLHTQLVCSLAGYGARTLQKRVAEGLMPQPVEKGHHFVYDRDQIFAALNLVSEERV